MFQPVSGNQHVHGFSWLNGTLTDLGTLESGTAAQSWALGINDSGVVVGLATLSGTFQPVKWSSGVISALATLGFGDNQATAISASGHIVGYCDNSLDKQRAVFWFDPSTPVDLGSLDSGNPASKTSYANGVNVNGRIVGKAMIRPDNVSFHGFRTAAGTPLFIDPAHDDLGTIFGGVSFNSEADGINDLDEAVGGSATVSGQFHAYWKAGNTGINDGYVDLGVLSGDNYSVALGINTTGTTVGYSRNAAGVQRAFVCYDDGIMHDLITKVSNPNGWTLQAA
jgi:probable HAF family extracellular repeat protein